MKQSKSKRCQNLEIEAPGRNPMRRAGKEVDSICPLGFRNQLQLAKTKKDGGRAKTGA